MTTSWSQRAFAAATASVAVTIAGGAFGAAALAGPGGGHGSSHHGTGNGTGNGTGGSTGTSTGSGTGSHGPTSTSAGHGQAGPHGDHGAGHGASHEHATGHGYHDGSDQGTADSSSHASSGHGHSGSHGQSGTHGQGGTDDSPTSPGPGAGHGNPPGNNGTVKIAAASDPAGTPSNNPHVGCTFYVEWFGYDQGSDVVSTVSFAPQAPTSDVTIGGTAPAQVFVGGDPAGGGTDVDGRQSYTLTFSGGAPHPKQGYHVKVTVSTPHSLGNDTKTKVFWVQPCETSGSGDDTEPSSAPTPTQTPDVSPSQSPTDVPTTTATTGSGNDTSTPQGVEASTLSAPGSAGGSGGPGGVGANGAAVPTSIDAGQGGSALPEWARSPLPLALIAGGLVLAAAGLVRRSRARG